MNLPAGQAGAWPRPPRIEYATLAPGQPLPPDALCAVQFGAAGAVPPDDPRCVRVGLQPLRGAGTTELWRVDAPVTVDADGPVHWARTGDFLAGRFELDERGFDSLTAAARHAYKVICGFQSRSGYPHLLRVWNYFDSINAGDGNAERYRQFCAGRLAGLAAYPGVRWPAATAIGRRDGSPLLQVYWLAGRLPGRPLENPRQVSAYHYPQQYGPSPPVFSRAMLVSGELLLISGTASILGHASHHPGDLARQVEETLDNLASLRRGGGAVAPRLAPRATAGSLLKVYLRDAAEADTVEDVLRRNLPPQVRWLVLAADVCRRELLVEIDCCHALP